eukprot:gene360-biopygen374
MHEPGMYGWSNRRSDESTCGVVTRQGLSAGSRTNMTVSSTASSPVLLSVEKLKRTKAYAATRTYGPWTSAGAAVTADGAAALTAKTPSTTLQRVFARL